MAENDTTAWGCEGSRVKMPPSYVKVRVLLELWTEGKSSVQIDDVFIERERMVDLKTIVW